MNDYDLLKNELKLAITEAVSELFSRAPDEKFYYFGLATQAAPKLPIFSAWSLEALEHACQSAEDKELLRWSYADSPYSYLAQDCFARFEHMLEQRSAELDEKEIEYRLAIMELAMRELDGEGLFHHGPARESYVLLVETTPPCWRNTLRAIRLNPPSALDNWLSGQAEW